MRGFLSTGSAQLGMLTAQGLLAWLVPLLAWRSAAGSDRQVLREVWNDLAVEYLAREVGEPSCTGCDAVRQTLDQTLPPPDNITRLRIELFKEELLRRLGLSEPPEPPQGLPVLPKPLLHRSQPLPPVQPSPTTFTDSKVITATDLRCWKDERGDVRLEFRLKGWERRGGKRTGGLWVNTGLLEAPVRLTSRPCQADRLSHSHPLSHIQGSWMVSDVTWMLKSSDTCFSFNVSIPTGNFTHNDCSFYQEIQHKPFLLIEEMFDQVNMDSREKREVNCREGVEECCREKLFLSFAEIGWGSWIIQPKGYQAYYCKGTCANPASISISGTPYHSVIKKLYTTEGRKKLEIVPCCTPTRLSSVQLIYADTNGTLYHKTIPNLTVEACGCM